MVENGWKRLTTDETGWTGLKPVENGWKQLKMAENGRTFLKPIENVWKQLKVVENGWQWLKFFEFDLKCLKTVEINWKTIPRELAKLVASVKRIGCRGSRGIHFLNSVVPAATSMLEHGSDATLPSLGFPSLSYLVC